MSISALAPFADLPSWDLTHFYSNSDAPGLLKDTNEAETRIQAFVTQYEGKVAGLTAEVLREAIVAYEAISEILGKIGSYAQLLYAADMSVPATAQFYQNTQETLTKLGSRLLFFTLSLNTIDEDAMERLLAHAALNHYAPWLRSLRALRPYQLSDEIETLLMEKQVAGHAAWSRHFDEVISDMRFEVGGESLGLEQALHLMSDKDETKRETAARAIGAGMEAQGKTFALITNTLAKDKAIEDEWRGFKRPISARNLANQVEDEVVDALMQAVQESYASLTHRYYALKAKWLGKEKLHYWDRAAPLPEAPERLYNWEEAKELVLSAYTAFSPRLGDIGRRFFEQAWVDAAIRPGKAPGAFAHPTVPSVHPYLLVNYLGKARDVMTLAHELGHGVHQVLAGKQGALLADTPLTLAETASVFGEQLVFREMLRRETDPARRKAILAGKVEDMLATVVRQVAMCQFEVKVHDERAHGELTSERLGEIWVQVQKAALGDAVILTPEYRYYWAYIPHFIHTPFYVYAYAFGDCLVNALYARYEDDARAGQAQDFEEKYLAMLAAGGRYRHQELLAHFGLDASDPAFWRKGLNIIEALIDELEAM